jgi:branched-chain amino acid transport system substrate-binding protein
MKKLLLLVSVLITVLAFQSCKKNHTYYVPAKIVDVRGLFSLTGNWSSLGVTSSAAVELAMEDINTYLAKKNAGFRMGVSVADTKLDVDVAKTLFAKANSEKIHFIIGPQSSAELAGLKPLSDAANIIVLSQSSTAGSLAIANDNIFRFCPSDKIEGAAIANTIAKKGIKGLVTVARDDAGNKGLQTSTGAAFTVAGGQIAAIDPYVTTTIDYTPVVASIKAQLNTMITTYGADKAAIYLASFDEGINIFRLAAADPVLSSVKWFGGDGVVLSTAFLNDPIVADFAVKTSFFAPSFGLSAATQDKWAPVAARIKAKTGTDPDAFALVAYDAMWTIAYTLEATNGSTDDFAALKAGFVANANKNTGIVGAEALDEFGDRSNGTFDYFGIVKNGTTYTWQLVGKSDE